MLRGCDLEKFESEADGGGDTELFRALAIARSGRTGEDESQTKKGVTVKAKG